jgi:hypothetical protein
MKGFPSLYPGRFVAIALGGLCLGYMAAAVVCQTLPTVYRSTVLVAKTEPEIERARLAPVHAALIQRDWEDDFQRPLTLPAGDLSRAVTFFASPYGVEVEVLSDDPKKGIDLAVRAAGLFRGMEHEIAAAAMNPDSIPHASTRQRQKRAEAIQLRELLNEDARSIGLADVFALREQADKATPKARALWQSEAFQARWTMFEERATRIGIDSLPGDPLTAPPAILGRRIQDLEYAPAITAQRLDRGMALGLLAGLLAAFWLARRKPGTAAPEAAPLAGPVVEW